MSSTEKKTLSAAEIAVRLHELCSAGQFETAQLELFSSDPLIQGNSIAFEFQLDFTLKEGGAQRLAEICFYQVADGKIIREQFFN